MKKLCEDSSPAILSLLVLLVTEIIHAADLVAQEKEGDFQTISNILLLMVGVYGLFFAITQMKTSRNGILLLCLGNFLVTVSAFVLNIDVFGNKVEQYSDLLTGWHVMWLFWTAVLLILFSGIGKSSYELVGKASQYLVARTGDSIRWMEGAVRKIHKGVLFSVLIGIAFWPVFLAGGYVLAGFPLEDFPKWSLVFWCSWFLVCMLITFFANFMPKIRQFVEEFDVEKLLKRFMMAVILLAAVFVALQIFPSLFQVLGTIFSYVLLLLLFSGTVFYIGRKLLSRSDMVCWCDVCVVLAIVLFVTFILLPVLGVSTQEGEAVLASDQIENMTKFVELFTAGVELVKTFL